MKRWRVFVRVGLSWIPLRHTTSTIGGGATSSKRRRVETAVERLIRAFGLAPETGEALSEGVYALYRNLVEQKNPR